MQSPQVIQGFGDKEVIKVATHCDAKHYLALTSDGEVYSWGNGDGGRLGHGDNMWVFCGVRVCLYVSTCVCALARTCTYVCCECVTFISGAS